MHILASMYAAEAALTPSSTSTLLAASIPCLATSSSTLLVHDTRHGFNEMAKGHGASHSCITSLKMSGNISKVVPPSFWITMALDIDMFSREHSLGACNCRFCVRKLSSHCQHMLLDRSKEQGGLERTVVLWLSLHTLMKIDNGSDRIQTMSWPSFNVTHLVTAWRSSILLRTPAVHRYLMHAY